MADKVEAVECNTLGMYSNILGDPGTVSRVERKDATKALFKHRRKSPWVPTLTEPFPNGQANAGSCLGTKSLSLQQLFKLASITPSLMYTTTTDCQESVA